MTTGDTIKTKPCPKCGKPSEYLWEATIMKNKVDGTEKVAARYHCTPCKYNFIETEWRK